MGDVKDTGQQGQQGQTQGPAATEDLGRQRDADKPVLPKVVYLRCKGEAYRGIDHGTGEFLSLIRGDVVKVSRVKAAQLLKDFPLEFVTSNEQEYLRSESDRSKRSKDLEREVKEREKRTAANERTKAIEDDDEDEQH